MTRYFIITGLDEGEPIKPYTTVTDGLLPWECMQEMYGDKCRYYEEISLDKYNNMIVVWNGADECYEMKDIREMVEYYTDQKDQFHDFDDFCKYHKLEIQDIESVAFLLYAMGLSDFEIL